MPWSSHSSNTSEVRLEFNAFAQETDGRQTSPVGSLQSSPNANHHNNNAINSIHCRPRR